MRQLFKPKLANIIFRAEGERLLDATSKRQINAISMFCAVCFDGRIFIQFIQENNNSYTTINFISKLSETLDDYDRNWGQDHVLLMGGCPSHAGEFTGEVVGHLGIPTIFLAPASFVCLPVEGFFGVLKSKEFNIQKT